MVAIIEQAKRSTSARVALLVAVVFISLMLIKVGSQDIHGRNSSPDQQGPAQGGLLGQEFGPNQAVQQIVDKIRPQLEQKSGLKFSSLDVISFKSQVVAGLNYFVKARAVTDTGDQKCIHLRIYNHWSDRLELTAFELDKRLEDRLVYFQ